MNRPASRQDYRVDTEHRKKLAEVMIWAEASRIAFLSAAQHPPSADEEVSDSEEESAK